MNCPFCPNADLDAHVVFRDDLVLFVQDERYQGALKHSGVIVPVRHAVKSPPAWPSSGSRSCDPSELPYRRTGVRFPQEGAQRVDGLAERTSRGG